MEEVQESPPPTITNGGGVSDRRREETSSPWSRVKKACLSFAVSLHETFVYLKSFLVGQGKKMRARNEKEATEADLQAAKMQVDAAEAAEDTKMRLLHSN